MWLFLLAGCVPKGRHEILEVQLEATRLALSARTAQSTADAQACDERLAAVEAEISRRQAQLDELAARGALADEALDQLEALRVELLAEIDLLRAERERLTAELAKRTKKPPEPEPVSTGEQRLAELAAALREHHDEQVQRQRLADARAEAEAAFATLVAEGRAELVQRGDALVVRIPTGLLFQEGFTTLSPRGQQIVAAAAEALAKVPGRRVTVEGHTDDRPVHTAEWPSNWERGFSRAVAVLRALDAAGAPARLSAESLAATRPLAPDDTAEGRARNDRVELVIELDAELLEAFAPTPPPEPEPEP